MELLPTDILITITTQLKIRESYIFSKSCKKYYDAVWNNENYWWRVCLTNNILKTEKSWKNTYLTGRVFIGVFKSCYASQLFEKNSLDELKSKLPIKFVKINEDRFEDYIKYNRLRPLVKYFPQFFICLNRAWNDDSIDLNNNPDCISEKHDFSPGSIIDHSVVGLVNFAQTVL